MRDLRYRHAEWTVSPTRSPGIPECRSVLFEATLQLELEGLNCIAWVDSIVMWGAYFDYLLLTLDAVLGRLECMGSGVAPNKCMPHHTSIK